VEDLIVRTGLRRDSVYKLICLPPISRRGGCALLQPAPAPSPTVPMPDGCNDDDDDDDDDDVNVVKSMLNALGGYVECLNDEIMDAMMITTCMMGPMYGVMRANRDWLGEFSVPSRGMLYTTWRVVSVCVWRPLSRIHHTRPTCRARTGRDESYPTPRRFFLPHIVRLYPPPPKYSP
jgi:hypothetical protein